MTTQQDERAELIAWLNHSADQAEMYSITSRDAKRYRKAAALLEADAKGGEAVAWQTRNRYCPKWEPCSKAFYDEFRFGKETHGVEVRELYATRHQPQAVAQPLTELLAAADDVCKTLEHPIHSVNAIQMWRLRDALTTYGIGKDQR